MIRIVGAMRRLRALAAQTHDPECLHQELDAFGRLTVRLAELAVAQTLKEQPE